MFEDFCGDVFGQGAGHVGGDEAGGDGVGGDAAGGEFAGGGFCEGDEGGFAGRVVGLAGVADEAADGGDVDDATVAGFHHGADDGAGKEEGGAEVGVEDALPVFVAHAQEECVAGDAGVVDENVDFLKFLEDGFGEGLGGFGVGDVAGEGVGLSTGGAAGFDSGCEAFRRAGHEGQGGAVLGEEFGNGEADSAAGAGDEGDVVFEITVHDFFVVCECNILQGLIENLTTPTSSAQLPESVFEKRISQEKLLFAMNKKILITGCTRGCGAALAEELAKRGNTIIGCGRDPVSVEKMFRKLGCGHSISMVDISQNDRVAAWAKSTTEKFGPVDFVINNAALIHNCAPLWKIPASEFDAVIDINVKGTANVLRHFLPAMVATGKGIIVNFSSGWGRSTSPNVAAYCASKWAIEGLTKSLAQELPRGVAAISLNPGIINTDMLRACFGAAAKQYPLPEDWAKKAAPYILSFSEKDNGRSLDVPDIPLE